MPKQIFLIGETQKAFAKQCIDEAPKDHVCTIKKATRSDRQNRKMWAMIRDIQNQVKETARRSADDVKCQFLNALGVEMRFIPTLDGNGSFPVGMRSSTLTKEQFAGLIELMFEWGARHNVKWSRESMEDA